MVRLRVALVASLVAILGAIQLLSMSAYGDLANPPAFPALLSAQWRPDFVRLLATPAFPPGMRLAAARALLHRDDDSAAAVVVAGLPEGADTWDLRGQLAERDGDAAAALEAYARAGDFERAQRLIDAAEVARGPAVAARFEAALAQALNGSGQAAVRARAMWRLGQLTQDTAAGGAAQRPALERSALRWYEAALSLAPNEETYLLAAGRQSLTLGDRAGAARYYRRALEAVPDSADARAGLAAALQ